MVLTVGVRAVQLLAQSIMEIKTNPRGNISTKMKNDIKEDGNRFLTADEPF